MNIRRRKTRQIKLGNLAVGSGNPVHIQSMPKLDIKTTKIFSRIERMVNEGCEIVRVAVKNELTAKSVGKLKKKIVVPLIADIHFNYKLALICIKEGIDGIRLNPGNIYKENHIYQIVNRAREYKAPIRIGVNSGSLDKYKIISSQSWSNRIKKYRNSTNFPAVEYMVDLTLDYIELIESMDFREIMISIKSEDVFETIIANRKIANSCSYPLHLGVTATGVSQEAIIKSAIGIGSLLTHGIGDIIRVSLTSDPITEIKVAKEILSSLHIREFGPEIISCPACSRAQIDVVKMTEELKQKISDYSKIIKVAVMGCEVNGPGEAKHADIGIAGGRNSVLLFKKGKKIRKVSSDKAVGELVKCIEEWDR